MSKDKKSAINVQGTAIIRAPNSSLSDMDTEPSKLVTRCDKTRDFKQAMLQELLTGRIRLV